MNTVATVTLLTALLLAPQMALHAANAPAGKPNVLLIITDDQGYGDFSLHGNPHLQTPHIDKLARTGVRFDRFYVNSFRAPTRAALLTGRWPLRTGCHGVTHIRESMRPAEVTLAEALKAAGYRSACIGKWHNGEHPRRRSIARSQPARRLGPRNPPPASRCRWPIEIPQPCLVHPEARHTGIAARSGQTHARTAGDARRPSHGPQTRETHPLSTMKPFSSLALLRSPLAALLTPGTLMTTPRALLLTALLLAPPAALHAADAPKPAAKITQELLNSIHVTPKLIFDPFPAYAQKYLPFAMAASMEVTHKGRLWTCWAGGQDGPNAYLLASYSDDQGRTPR